MANKVQCSMCEITFSNVTNLRRHAKNKHNDLSLAPMKYKEEKNFLYTCTCGRNFNHKRHFQSHMKVHKDEKSEPNIPNSDYRNKQCPLCDFSSLQKEKMLFHFRNVHEINIAVKDLSFDNINDFEEWRNSIKDAAFVTEFTKILNTYKLKVYKCNRSGVYIPKRTESDYSRHLKLGGSNKMNSFCPASIKLKEGIDGKCNISYIETHVGHKNDIGHLFLKPHERKQIARKISAKIPFNAILNEIRDSVTEFKLERIHLLTKKDLHNIEHSFNLNSDPSLYIALDHESKETEVLVSHLNKQKTTVNSFNDEKEKLHLKFTKHFNSIKSVEELEILKKCLAPLSPNLAAMKFNTNKQFSDQNPAVSHNKKIETQRRLFSTKKKRKPTSEEGIKIIKPSMKESQTIAISLKSCNK